MRNLVIAAVLLLLFTNLVVLFGVMYNRSGDPVASSRLTERELTIVDHYANADENTGTALSIRWYTLDNKRDGEVHYYNRGNPRWLDDEKLKSLGFDLDNIKKNKHKYISGGDSLSTEVIFVLEYNGDTYRQALVESEKSLMQLQDRLAQSPENENLAKQLGRQEKQLKRMRLSESRLYVIDAGYDEQVLAQKYTEYGKYLFMRGELALVWRKDELIGQVRKLFVDNVHVPLPYAKRLQALTKGERYYSYGVAPIAPRYQIRLNIGKRLEPWIESISSLPATVK